MHLQKLEWNTITKALAERTRSPLGQTTAHAHHPFSTSQESARLRERVKEAVHLTNHSNVHALVADVQDCRPFFERASREGVLGPSEIYRCGQFIHTVCLLGGELRERKASVPLWAGDFELAPKTPPLCEQIRRSVNSENVILDTASTELARLRRELTYRRSEFEVRLDQKLKDWNQSGILQDSFYDVMDGRYVVPVRAESQSKMQGTLVAKSNTGQSVFIEPAELTVSNNALKEIELAIHTEEFRILRDLSRAIGGYRQSFDPWVPVVAELDLALAAAVLAKDWELEPPTVPAKASGEMKLPDLFHPGLKLRPEVSIVRNSFFMPADGHAILISGPNTGGKTVLLKAVGLACAMASSGLFVPAAADSVVPHYAGILAFIGDEQSLSSGLSSFSAQIREMQSALNESRTPLLIVIDEILASTNPEEASALAQAIIEEFVGKGHHVLVTSHFSDLSVRARQHAHIAVAAMEFDRGVPTYRLRPDEMGSSHALEIAQRLGFPAKLLDRAQSLVSTLKLDYENAIAQLRDRESLLEEEFSKKKRALEQDFEREQRAFKTKLEIFVHEGNLKIEQQLKEATAKFEKTHAVSLKRAQERITADVKDVKKAIETEVVKLKKEVDGIKEPVQKMPEIEVGCTVKVKSMKGSRGVVVEMITAPGVASNSAHTKVRLQVGNFRLERPLDDLEWVSGPAKKKAPSKMAVSYDTSAPSPLKVDVRGKRFDEALAEAERSIDYAFRSGAPAITVVTGHGTGALKAGLKELLKNLPYVREFKSEREGDDGATRVEF